MKKIIEIKLLAECVEHIPYLAELWYEQISRHWAPDASIERAKQKLLDHVNSETLPLALVAFDNEQPVGMAALRVTDGIQPELAPWLGSLVVDPAYRKQKIGERLIEAVKQRALSLGYVKLYLLAFDKSIPGWYEKLGWVLIGRDRLFGHDVAVMEIKMFNTSANIVLTDQQVDRVFQ